QLADRTFQPVKTRRDEIGIWAETVLNLADDYERQVYEMVKAGKLGWSSGSSMHRTRKAADGHIKSWPILEGSLTPTPAEPRNYGGILPIKSLQTLTLPEGTKVMGTTDASAGGTLVPAAAPAAEKKDEKAKDCELPPTKAIEGKPLGH